VLHLTLLFMNNFNKTEAAIFSMEVMLSDGLIFFSDELELITTIYEHSDIHFDRKVK